MTTTTDDGEAQTLSPGEEYLRNYHDRRPGRQSIGTESARLEDGRTSYELLADRVTDAQAVLDLGCADGALLAVLAARGVPQLAGIDLSEQELALACKRPELAQADLRSGRAQHLPWPDESFDAVTAHMSLMLMDDVDRVLAESARVLRPGGRLGVATGGGPVPGGGVELLIQLVGKYFRTVPEDRRIPRFGDRRTRDRDGFKALISQAGFGELTWERCVVERKASAAELWEEFLDSLYGMEALDQAQRQTMHEEFLEQARELTDSDGHLPGGMIINVAVTRLS
jgi:ubiquinone/menaquinone biosynthesis C-methylase UbiE